MDSRLFSTATLLVIAASSCGIVAFSTIGCAGGEMDTATTNQADAGDNDGGNSEANNGDNSNGQSDPENKNDNNGEDDNKSENNGEDEADCDDPTSINPRPTVADPEADDPCRPDDGWATNAVFVASHGSDVNDGTLASPVETIEKGLEKAENSGAEFVLVEAGTYEEEVEIRNGIQLLSHYTTGFQHQESARAQIEGQSPVLSATEIETPTRVKNFQFELTADVQEQPEQSVITAFVRDSDGLILDNVEIYGGRAGDGLDGQDGADGADGQDGADGTDAPSRWAVSWNTCNQDDSVPGGVGGTNVCSEADGGDGGDGARYSNLGGDGETSAGGILGGLRGEEGEDGSSGAQGLLTNTGQGGDGGSAGGSFDGLQWNGEDGESGEDGEPGDGGGGGGAGGGASMTTCNHWGAAGGGGGAGGCGGEAGTGGTHGGASVALFLEKSPGVELRNSYIEGGTGGDGGKGGTGGLGGLPGEGGEGGAAIDPDYTGRGGDGGNGGEGGDGGHGGGGAGGPSFALFSTVELTTDLEDSDIVAGDGGRGGGPDNIIGGSAAEDGLEAAIQIGLE